MTKKVLPLPKSLHGYVSKLKRRTLHFSPPSTSTTATRIFSACKYPKTPSSDACHDHPTNRPNDTAATLEDVDLFLFENFRSLYTATNDAEEPSDHLIYDSPRLHADPPWDALRESDRFFVSPGVTGSLVEEARLSTASTPSNNSAAACTTRAHVDEARPSTRSSTSDECPAVVPDSGVAVVMFSKDPCDDFRRSMQSMVDARHVEPGETLDWDFMKELLFCFLELNERSVHEYILRAFVDLAAGFRRRPPAG